MDQNQLKERVAHEAVNYIQDGMKVGLGTGSTIYYAIQKLSERIKNGLDIIAIPTSTKTTEWANEYGIPLTDFSKVEHLDIVIDGADEVDEHFQMIKGGGGALLREKIVANATDAFIVIVDESKLVHQLGNFQVPIEVIPFGFEVTAKAIEALGGKSTLRTTDKGPFITDNQNYILDCDFGLIEHPEKFNHDLISIIGVVETGLFIDMASKVLVSRSDTGKVDELNR
nr:ribose-5-phosphate isomerase RpiA [Mammaliicoccus sp. Marseille-Q6498]